MKITAVIACIIFAISVSEADVRATPYYSFHNSFWINPHQSLFHEASLRARSKDGLGVMPLPAEAFFQGRGSDVGESSRLLSRYRPGMPGATQGLPRSLACGPELAQRGAPDYVPYADKSGVYDRGRGWEEFRSAIQNDWQRYIEGKKNYEEAINKRFSDI